MIWRVLLVMKLWEMSKVFSLLHIEVNMPTLDTKQSSSSLQLAILSYMSPFEIFTSLTNWHTSWKFCLVSLTLLISIFLSF